MKLLQKFTRDIFFFLPRSSYSLSLVQEPSIWNETRKEREREKIIRKRYIENSDEIADTIETNFCTIAWNGEVERGNCPVHGWSRGEEEGKRKGIVPWSLAYFTMRTLDIFPFKFRWPFQKLKSLEKSSCTSYEFANCSMQNSFQMFVFFLSLFTERKNMWYMKIWLGKKKSFVFFVYYVYFNIFFFSPSFSIRIISVWLLIGPINWTNIILAITNR